MKVTIDTGCEQNAPSYPCLKKSEQGNLVLFVKEKTGTVLGSDSGVYRVGYHIDHWCEEDFKPFHGSVRIEN